MLTTTVNLQCVTKYRVREKIFSLTFPKQRYLFEVQRVLSQTTLSADTPRQCLYVIVTYIQKTFAKLKKLLLYIRKDNINFKMLP